MDAFWFYQTITQSYPDKLKIIQKKIQFDVKTSPLQVNICQKLSFLHLLTHYMTTYCSLNYKKNTSSAHVVYTNCFECQNKKKLCTQHVLSLYSSDKSLPVINMDRTNMMKEWCMFSWFYECCNNLLGDIEHTILA